jgi:hypothetical protein
MLELKMKNILQSGTKLKTQGTNHNYHNSTPNENAKRNKSF